jgi:TRAP-type C4-dicarboxylate transport system substrate-binding protein
MKLAAFALAALAVTVAHARDFRSAEVHPADYPTTQAVMQMGKLLAERSGGKLGVKVYPSGALGSEKDNIEQLRLGGLDMMRINVAPLNSVVPETIATGLPFIFRSTEHMRTVLDGPIGRTSSSRWRPRGSWGSRSTTRAPAPSIR